MTLVFGLRKHFENVHLSWENKQWNLYLVGVKINLFAATGHVHYVKCARLYLQNMSELDTHGFTWGLLHIYVTQENAVIATGIDCGQISSMSKYWCDLLKAEVVQQPWSYWVCFFIGVLKLMNPLVSSLISFMLTVSSTLS